MVLEHPDAVCDGHETFAVKRFIQRLDDATLKQKVLERLCKTLDEALLAAQQTEAWALEVQEEETATHREQEGQGVRGNAEFAGVDNAEADEGCASESIRLSGPSPAGDR